MDLIGQITDWYLFCSFLKNEKIWQIARCSNVHFVAQGTYSPMEMLNTITLN